MKQWTCTCGKVVVTIKGGDAIVDGEGWWVKGNDKEHVVCSNCNDKVRVGYRIVSTDHRDSATYKLAKGSRL